MSNTVIGVRISKQDRELLNKICRARGEDLSDFVRLAIRRVGSPLISVGWGQKGLRD
jgi:uncharacterized protein (DUF1778 family)